MRREQFVKCRVTAEYYNEKQERFKKLARDRGWKFEPQPVEVHYLGNIYKFNPECELPETVARVLNEKRWYVEIISEPYEKFDESGDPTDAIEEDQYKFGKVYLCKHCGWPFPKVNSRNMHERRWCKRKDD